MTPPLAHPFRDPTLLVTALTHPSWSNEHPGTPHYQRLEFLGDSIVGALLSDLLYRTLPDWDEGALHRARTAIVRTETFAEFALALDLGTHVRAQASLLRDGLPQRVLADVFEACVGDLWLDGGWEAAATFVEPLVRARVEAYAAEHARTATTGKDARSALQEWLEARKLPPPSYTLTDTTGPAHDRRFHCTVSANGRSFGPTEGTSKRGAAQAVADLALAALLVDRNAPPVPKVGLPAPRTVKRKR